jgi:hypothetical protein
MSFTTCKQYIDLFRGHTQCFEVSECSKTHHVLPRIVMVRYDVKLFELVQMHDTGNGLLHENKGAVHFFFVEARRCRVSGQAGTVSYSTIRRR